MSDIFQDFLRARADLLLVQKIQSSNPKLMAVTVVLICCAVMVFVRFSYDEMLNLKGNTAVYLQYAHARIAAIGRKGGITDFASLAATATLSLEHEKEVGKWLLLSLN